MDVIKGPLLILDVIKGPLLILSLYSWLVVFFDSVKMRSVKMRSGPFMTRSHSGRHKGAASHSVALFVARFVFRFRQNEKRQNEKRPLYDARVKNEKRQNEKRPLYDVWGQTKDECPFPFSLPKKKMSVPFSLPIMHRIEMWAAAAGGSLKANIGFSIAATLGGGLTLNAPVAGDVPGLSVGISASADSPTIDGFSFGANAGAFKTIDWHNHGWAKDGTYSIGAGASVAAGMPTAGGANVQLVFSLWLPINMPDWSVANDL